MPQLTRMDKYRRYRAQIARMANPDHLPPLDETLSSPRPALNQIEKDPDIHRTTTISRSDIIKATQEIPGQPVLDDDQLEQEQNRRFILKVVLICVLVVIVIIVSVIWLVNGG